MAQAKGSSAQVGIQEETTYKTDPAPDLTRIHVVSFDLGLDQALEEAKTIQSNRNAVEPFRGRKNVPGTMVVELQAYIAKLFKGLLGANTTTGASPYTHTMKVGTSIGSFVIEKGFTDIAQYFKLNGVKIGKMSMSITDSGPQPITFTLVGAKETVSGTTFDATQTDLGKTLFDGLAIGVIEEGGSTSAIITSIDGLTIDNGLDEGIYTLGSLGERVALPEGTVKVTGTVKAIFDSITLYNKAMNSTESSIKVKYVKGDGLGSAGNESIEFYIPELKYATKSPPIAGPQGVYVELPFTGFYGNDAAATIFQVILKNTQATI